MQRNPVKHANGHYMKDLEEEFKEKVMSALSFYMTETDEISERYIAPCFMNGVEAFNGEVNLAFDENLFIINPEEDDFVPEVILGRSFLRIANGIVDFELPSFVCKMGKSNHNKKRAMENLNLFYQDVGPSSGAGVHLTQEEAAKEALAIRISQRHALFKEKRLIIETMAYNDKYKKILNEI
uniref:Uncharacterized protein n=1 Tax=Tanacetum cinerariifolium TaxID=118510 RepID=A0A6L2MKG0_TANCI|nr:hypothetical protein [Tanacetum cinerariifolium]